MEFNKHTNLEGRHALLGASKYQWLGDTESEVTERVARSYLTEMGTQLHDIARKRIKYSVKLKKGDKDSVVVDLLDKGIPRFVIDTVDFDSVYSNLMNYTNDAVGFRMIPEVILVYSENVFGTCDAIKFSEKERELRIHDLKTGVTPAHMEQLLIYSALFCLEYGYQPSQLSTELRIYQLNDIAVCEPEAADIAAIMAKIKSFDKIIKKL